MITKFLLYNNLYLIYKDLLNQNNKDIFNLYYGENLTMQEIALMKGISKSRVGMIIKNVERKLDNFENQLHFNKKIDSLNRLLTIDDIDKIKAEIKKIIKGE